MSMAHPANTVVRLPSRPPPARWPRPRHRAVARPFKAGQSGNPAGRPIGSRNASTIIMGPTLYFCCFISGEVISIPQETILPPLLDRYDVRRSEPPIAAVPRRPGEQVSIFFRKDEIPKVRIRVVDITNRTHSHRLSPTGGAGT